MGLTVSTGQNYLNFFLACRSQNQFRQLYKQAAIASETNQSVGENPQHNKTSLQSNSSKKTTEKDSV